MSPTETEGFGPELPRRDPGKALADALADVQSGTGEEMGAQVLIVPVTPARPPGERSGDDSGSPVSGDTPSSPEAHRATPAAGPYSIGSDLWPGLSRLNEEAGEVIQVIGKLIGAHGENGHWDGTDLRERLTTELADLLAAIGFVVDKNGLDWAWISERSDAKRAMYERWHADALPEFTP